MGVDQRICGGRRKEMMWLLLIWIGILLDAFGYSWGWGIVAAGAVLAAGEAGGK